MTHYTIYVDGSCRGNPGPAGIGIAIYDSELEDVCCEKISMKIGTATNNIAEYEATIHAVRWLKNRKIDSAVIKMDSELVYNQILGKYKVKEKHLSIQRRRLVDLMKHVKQIQFQLIPRERNKVANRLAQAATKGQKIKNSKAVQKDIFTSLT